MERFSDFRQFDEAKDNIINKLTSLSDEQKKTIRDFFNTHNDLESKIDWNRAKSTRNPLTWSDFKAVMDEYDSRLLPREGIADLTEGEDYEEIPFEEGKAYAIYNHRASVAIACNNTEPQCWSYLPSWYQKENAKDDYPYNDDTGLYGGAKWCTAMHHTAHYFKDYTAYGCMLIYMIWKDFKYAVLLDKDRESNPYNPIKGIWDFADKDVSNSSFKPVVIGFLTKQRAKIKECVQKFMEIRGTDSNSEERENAVENFGESAVEAFEDWWSATEDDTPPYEHMDRYYVGYGDSAELFLYDIDYSFEVDDIKNYLDLEAVGMDIFEDEENSLSDEELKEIYSQYYDEEYDEWDVDYEELASNSLDDMFINNRKKYLYMGEFERDYKWLYVKMDWERVVENMGCVEYDGHWFYEY